MENKSLDQTAYEILVERAINNKPIYYGDFYDLLGLDCRQAKNRQIGSKALEDVNIKSGTDYMLSAFVVGRGNNEPYEGFYKLAMKWKRLSYSSSKNQKYAFWIDEMKRVHEKYLDNLV